MADYLDGKRPYRALDEGSDPELAGPDFVEQDGIIFGWSESNVDYERAWWLYDDAPDCTLTHHLRAARAPAGLTLPLPTGN